MPSKTNQASQRASSDCKGTKPTRRLGNHPNSITIGVAVAALLIGCTSFWLANTQGQNHAKAQARSSATEGRGGEQVESGQTRGSDIEKRITEQSSNVLDPGANHSFPYLHEPAQPTNLLRDLGNFDSAQQKQLEGLIDVHGEFGKFPIRCAICRILGLEAFAIAVKLGIDATNTSWTSSGGPALQSIGHAAAMLNTTLHNICSRLKRQLLLGVMKRRGIALFSACAEFMGEMGRQKLLLKLAAEVAMAATVTASVSKENGRVAKRLAPAGPLVDQLCGGVCLLLNDRGQCGTALPGWAAMLEVILGREPLHTNLLNTTASDAAFTTDVSSALLFFASAKSDAQAVRVVVALSHASPIAIQSHGDGDMLRRGLGVALARLMSPPSIQHQLKLLRRIDPDSFGKDMSDKEVFLRRISARFTVRIDDSAVKDTALHIVAFGYDHETLLALLVRDGGGAFVDTPDSLGRTALHYAADAIDQIASLVNVFAEAPSDVEPIIAQRTASRIRMAADHVQAIVVRELSAAQLSTVRLLLAFGANPNVQAAVSGNTPLHLAARSGATAVAQLLISHGATLESRNRHGSTPLIVATIHGHAETCAALLQAGGRLDARNAHGRTASWYARAAGSALSSGDTMALFGVRKDAQAASASVAHTTEQIGIGGGWGAADNESVLGVLPSRLRVCEVDRKPTDLSPAVFEADYLIASRPVIVQGGANHMRAKTTWTRSDFFQKFGQEVFGPQKLPLWKAKLLERSKGGPDEVTLARYFEEVSHGLHPRPLSWNNPRNSSLWAVMENDLAWPSSMLTPTTRRLGAGGGYFGLFLGPQGSGISKHHHKAAWNALLFGQKLWVLTPPAQSDFRRDELAADSFMATPTGQGWMEEAARRDETYQEGSREKADDQTVGTVEKGGNALLFCVQREGDVLFVPQGWGHSTINLRESLGVANFFLDEDAAGYRPSKVFHSTRGMRSLQTAAGITSPSDFSLDGHP
eukprot:TRINITY_DN42980_c0_g1_i1.p1 TRINITY_DN42980_c0_g1~~TRINITY_DN42980_c0_g1_i1.p1  ORF type:complete len:982 (-),score=131.52 TRINITY_DN42980_c0_g1_i1:136-3081(-)